MRSHAIQTGTVQLKERQRRGVGPGPLRAVATMLDRAWTEPLPILAWLVEHDEGLIVVDTGETARASQPGHFPAWHPYFRLAVRAQVAPEEEIGPQLERLGFSPSDVRRVVLTHLHTDHAGGLDHFPDSEILVAREELAFASGALGRVRGYLPAAGRTMALVRELAVAEPVVYLPSHDPQAVARLQERRAVTAASR